VNVLCVPVEAVTTREDSTDRSKMLEVVFTISMDKAKMNLVETGIQDEKYIEIKSGIEDVKKVVRGPFDAVSRKLSDGSNIIVSEKTKF
jgi:HlyD family secretion protein